MDIQRIVISLNDNNTFTQIAFLVDQSTFIDEVARVRKIFKITQPLSFDDLDSFDKHFANLAGVDFSKMKSQDKSLSELRLSIFDSSEKYQSYLKQDDEHRQLNQSVEKIIFKLKHEVSKIRIKHGYPKMFDDPITQAILYGEIRHFRTAYADFFPKDPKSENELYMAIVVTPYSTKKDIAEAFRQCKKDIRETVEMVSPVYQKLSKDTITNIKRDRDWYWRNKMGESPHSIAVNDNGDFSKYKEIMQKMKFAGDLNENTRKEYNRYLSKIEFETETIRKALKRYTQRLTAI